MEEGMVELISFHHDDKLLFLAEQQVAVEVVGNASDEGSGIHPALVEDVRHHSRSGGFAMSTRHSHGEMSLRNLAQSLCTFHDGQIALT